MSLASKWNMPNTPNSTPMITLMYEELASIFLIARNRHDPTKFKLPVDYKETPPHEDAAPRGSAASLEMEQRVAEAREEGRKEGRIEQKCQRKQKRRERKHRLNWERKEMEQRIVEAREKGRREGRREGREEGRIEGER